MEQVHESVKQMWRAYLESIGRNDEDPNMKYEAWHFCDNEKDADELAELASQGVKRATTGLYFLYELEKEALPEVGNLNVVTDWNGIARCIIKTIKVMVLPFRDVPEEFAYTEGEGDKSLDYWRRVHVDAFSRYMKPLNMEFNEDMQVVCEEFEVVYK